jgi:AcrR family transcriptional regulator
VLEAARSLFCEASFGDIGVAQILERAGVQAPTLYHHFGDKEGLFLAWSDKAFGKIEEEVHARAGGENTIDSLTRYSTALLSTIEFDLFQVLRDAPRLQRPESRDRLVGSYMRSVYEPLATILVQAVATGEFRSDPVPQLSDVFLGGLLALRHSHENGGWEARAAWWCQAFVRAFAAERAVVYR